MIAPPVTLDEAFVDAPHTEPGQFDADRVIDTYQTAQHLRAMRDETPRLRTLAIIDALYDIVMAIRERWCRE